MDPNALSGNVYVVLSSVCIGDVNINSKYPPSRFMLNIHENSQLYHGHDWCWINSSPLSAPVGPHVGPINRAIRECLSVAHPGDFEVIIEFVSYLIIWPWASCQIENCGLAYPGNAGNVFPDNDFKGNHQLSIPACITARASRTCRDACRDR